MKRLMDVLTNKKVKWTVSLLYSFLFCVYSIGYFTGNANDYITVVGYASVVLYTIVLIIDSIVVAFFNGEYEGVDMSARLSKVLRFTLVLSRILGVFILYRLMVPKDPIDWAIVVWLGVQVAGHVYLYLFKYIMNTMFPEKFNAAVGRKSGGRCRPISAVQSRIFLHDGESIDMHEVGKDQWSAE